MINCLYVNFYSAGIEVAPGRSDFLCPLANISQCALTETDDNLVFLIYNPLTKPIEEQIVRIPVKEANIQVFDKYLQEINVEFVPVPQFVKNIPGRDSESQFDAVFLVKDIPPLGYQTYFLKKNEIPNPDLIVTVEELESWDDLPIIANVGYYQGSGQEPQPSGAYIFR